MKPSNALTRLATLVAILAVLYSSIGLFSQSGAGPFSFTSLHGEVVQIYGRGLYHNDTLFRAPILRGTDAITLFVGVPLLLLAIFLDRRGGLRSRLFLTSLLAFFLYNSASLALGAAYNNLLLAYIISVSASLFAFVIGLCSIDLHELAAQTSSRMPYRWISIFLLLAAMSLVIWIVDILAALAQGGVPPTLDHYTTEATYTLDVGIILPAALLASTLVWRRQPLGTLLASILITLNMTVGLVVASQSIMQALEGVLLTPGEYAAYVAPFVTLSLVATGLLASLYRNLGGKQA
jgi:hypothetical protein